MDRITFKSSTVWIGTEENVAVYPSLEDVPPKLRLRLSANIQSDRAVTILIADKRGRRELVRRLAVQDAAIPKTDEIAATKGGGIFFSRLEAQLFALVVVIIAITYFLFQH